MSIWHLLILLLVVVVIFGTSKLRNMGGDLGSAIRDFKKGLSDEEPAKKDKDSDRLRADPPAAESTTQEAQRDSADRK
ncbi:twin-arginine translocase TatA/TatE family subunit [Frateuria defendens]|uniref:twin-arginine translocase TatA/TatE family subunit n=1 Tax=Frateuria defendens TaxID=2219559 RepID=UPI00066FDC6D|nr:twin-arginine translocase TatA/TatE family subunit [Frateuria defendens]